MTIGHGTELPLAQRPAGDLLEEVVSTGPAEFARYLGAYPSLPGANRVAVLLGGLALGPEIAADWRTRLSSRESAEKRALAFGLGEVGHPDAEAYLARLVRERPSAEAAAAALRGLGKIANPRTLPLVLGALADDLLLPAACDALARYGGREAVAALLARASEPPAFRALASLGAPEAREVFLNELRGEGGSRADAARALGLLGDPALGTELLPHLTSEDDALRRAAWEAYVALGAPGGPAPLLSRVEAGAPPWVLELLSGVDHPEVHALFAGFLARPAPAPFWKRFWSWRRRSREALDRRTLFRGLRGAQAAEQLELLVSALGEEEDALALREILENPFLCDAPGYEAALTGVWKRGDLVCAYLAARTLLACPTVALLADAVGFLALPGFRALDGATPLTDPAHLLDVYAHENNPFLLLGGFLDSGLVPVPEAVGCFERQLAGSRFPPEVSAAETFRGADGCGLAAFLEAFANALPGSRRELHRLWNLLAQTHVGRDAFLDLLLCHAGAHRGGLQRTILRELPAALGQLLAGKDDAFLPELDRIAARLPPEGPLRSAVGRVLEKCRATLMAECRDLVVFTESSPRGDMVLIAEL